MNGIRAVLLAASVAFVGCAAERQANRDVQTTAGVGQDITDDLASGATSSGSPSNAVIVPQSPTGPATAGGVNPSGATLAGTPDSSGPMSVTSGSSGALSPASESAGSTENSMAPRDGTGDSTTAGATPSGNDAPEAGTGGSGETTDPATGADPGLGAQPTGGNVGAGSTGAETEETRDDGQQ